MSDGIDTTIEATLANQSEGASFVERLLDAPAVAQKIFNYSMQAIKSVAFNKWRPPLNQVFNIPNIKTSNWVLAAPIKLADQVLEYALEEWMKPNLGGIIIDATSESMGRQVDISENMIIVQAAGVASREYNTDNTAPHPRTWSIQGYLSQNIPWVDDHFILRPTLVLQQSWLDAYAASRKPILYRSGLCPIPTKVLIESYQLTRQVEGTQAYAISIELREFVTYTVPFYNKASDAGVLFQTDPSTGITEATKYIGPAPLPGVTG